MLRRHAVTNTAKKNAKRIGRAVPALAAATAFFLAGGLAVADAAEGDSVDDLRGDVPTVSELRDGLAGLDSAETILRANMAQVEANLTDQLARRDQMTIEGQLLTAQIETATRDLRELAVTAYMSGGSTGDVGLFLDIGEAADVSWRNYLLTDRAQATDDLAGQLLTLRSTASSEVVDAVDGADRARSELADLQIALDDVTRGQRALQEQMVLAEAWDRVAIAVAEGPYGIAPMSQWEKLRFCESTHDYGVLNGSGKYRGAYQFDYATWATVGGAGDPAAASPSEQDARARELYAWRGHSPWPECGRYLPGGS